MPRYYFRCPRCAEQTATRLRAGQQTKPRECSTCHEILVRDPQPPSTQVMEELDNGAMGKRVERLKDAEILRLDRAQSDPRKV